MKKTLSIDEQRKILGKLRSEYLDYGSKYGTKVFDIEAFEKRYEYALKMKFDMGGFFLREIGTVEELKSKIEERIKGRENRFIDRVEKMVEENLKKIAHYRDYRFHPKASYELCKAVGALYDFYHEDFMAAERIILSQKDRTLTQTMNEIHRNIEYLVGEKGRDYAPRIMDHILLLDKKFPDHKKVELDEKRFIKDIALILNKLKDFLVNAIYEEKLVGGGMDDNYQSFRGPGFEKGQGD